MPNGLLVRGAPCSMCSMLSLKPWLATWRSPLGACTQASWSAVRTALQPPSRFLSTARDWAVGSEHTDARAGLFGLTGLKQPSDFNRMMQETKSRCGDLMASLLSSEPSAQTVQLMDDMSDVLCQCYDAAEACRNIHDDPSWRAAATAVCHELGGEGPHTAHISVVNHHEGMYAKLSAALARAGHPRPAGAAAGGHQAAHTTDSPARDPSLLADRLLVGGWCPETLRVGQQLALDMEKAGIHLPYAGRTRMQMLMNDNNHYSATFNKALRDPRHLGNCVVHGSTVTLSAANVAHIMTNEPNEHTRQAVWLAASRSPASNLSLLEHVCAARREQAGLLGAPSYSRYKAQGASLAEQPAAIVAFLQQLATEVRPTADEEVKSLARVKASLMRTADAASVSVAPWDTDFLMATMRRGQQALPQVVVHDHLHLPLVLEGMAELFQRTLGVTLHTRTAGPHESWAHGVLRCDASHPDMGHMGTVYLDLCSRPHKYPSAVTFPIRCGRQLPDGAYQAPIMALLADFGRPYCSPHDVRLTSRDLRVLLHEWGHCMHNLASRTRYQHLAGTRCAQDLVELPSHLFEHWTADPRSLRLLARHHSTRDPLPTQACRALAEQRRRFAGLELQQQVLLSLADQRLFGAEPMQPGGTSQAWAEATTPYSSLPWVKGSHPEARMSHLTIYGATYYSYVYARCLSAAVWAQMLAEDPLAPAAGQAVMQGLLRPGGAIEPVALLTGALGPGALTQHPSGGWAPSLDPSVVRAAMATFG